jgi:hypothetical protein
MLWCVLLPLDEVPDHDNISEDGFEEDDDEEHEDEDYDPDENDTYIFDPQHIQQGEFVGESLLQKYQQHRTPSQTKRANGGSGNSVKSKQTTSRPQSIHGGSGGGGLAGGVGNVMNFDRDIAVRRSMPSLPSSASASQNLASLPAAIQDLRRPKTPSSRTQSRQNSRPTTPLKLAPLENANGGGSGVSLPSIGNNAGVIAGGGGGLVSAVRQRAGTTTGATIQRNYMPTSNSMASEERIGAANDSEAPVMKPVAKRREKAPVGPMNEDM